MLPVPWGGLTRAGVHGGSAEGKDPLVGNSVPWIMFNLKTRGLQLSQWESQQAGRGAAGIPEKQSEACKALHFTLSLT